MIHAALLCASLLVGQIADPHLIIRRYQDV